MSTTYMSLSLPAVSGTAGPTWATNVNTALTLVDAHDHTTNKGTPVPTAGININADLSFGGYQATSLKSTKFTSQSSALAGTYTNCLFVYSGDLYYNNGSGSQVQLTTGGSISLASVGGITGMSGTTATATYSSGSLTFTWRSNTNVGGLMDCGAITVRPAGVSTYGVTIVPDATIAAAYTLTLPAAFQVSTKILTVSSAGAIGAVYDTDGATLEVSSNSLRVKDAGITAAKLATTAGVYLVAGNFNSGGTLLNQRGSSVTLANATRNSAGNYTVAVTGVTTSTGIVLGAGNGTVAVSINARVSGAGTVAVLALDEAAVPVDCAFTIMVVQL